MGIISGSIWGSFQGRDHLGGCTGHAHLYQAVVITFCEVQESYFVIVSTAIQRSLGQDVS